MRLNCPNCAAQYEVPDEVIPTSGRDVQCSNCGYTWFQSHPDHPTSGPASQNASEESQEQQDWVEPDLSEEQAQAQTDADSRRELDDDVVNVLREEAERETKARAAEVTNDHAQQSDQTVDDGAEEDKRAQQARSRMARLRGLEEDTTEEVTAAADPDPSPTPRREMLPDIEDIDSSIEEQTGEADPNASARDGSRAVEEPKHRSGFRRGVRWAIFLAIIATLVYTFAAEISVYVPELTELLSSYVDKVNEGRAFINAKLEPVVEMIRPKIDQLKEMIGI